MLRFTFVLICLSALCLTAMGTERHGSSGPPNVVIIQPPTSGGSGGSNGGSGGGTCPRPSAETLRCMREWACQYLVNLDLRCLLNLNGNPLLGGLLGGATGGGAPAGGATGGNGGLLTNLLG